VILLLSNERDLTTDYIVQELQRRNIEYFRLNSERLASAIVRFTPEPSDWTIEYDGTVLAVSNVGAAYFRRPGLPTALTSIKAADERRYCEQEWLSVLHSLYGALENRWLNAPAHIAAAEDKPRQLALAAKIGFALPQTLVTNDPQSARLFIRQGRSVAKTLRAGLLTNEGTGEERVIFTNRVTVADDSSFSASVQAAPLILQREIEKKADIRATVVDDTVMAASIESQVKEETVVDWRKGSHVDLPHDQHRLPLDVEEKCRALTAALNLRFAAIDLILDRANQYWFLEANPNGQWAWIESRTGHLISRRLVDALLATAQASAEVA
jgi:glutathione synthase/RimK-type ligase-like ATP-grasp enzyme